MAIETVEQTLPFLSPPVAEVCRLQLLTGMRPSEVLQMRSADVNRSDEIWIYPPRQHKTPYLGVDKQVSRWDPRSRPFWRRTWSEPRRRTASHRPRLNAGATSRGSSHAIRTGRRTGLPHVLRVLSSGYAALANWTGDR